MWISLSCPLVLLLLAGGADRQDTWMPGTKDPGLGFLRVEPWLRRYPRGPCPSRGHVEFREEQ